MPFLHPSSKSTAFLLWIFKIYSSKIWFLPRLFTPEYISFIFLKLGSRIIPQYKTFFVLSVIDFPQITQIFI